MAVETTPQVASTRQSVRITTQSQFNGGLFIMDAVHMPTGIAFLIHDCVLICSFSYLGCATWPACKFASHFIIHYALTRPIVWTNGPNWPNNGEVRCWVNFDISRCLVLANLLLMMSLRLILWRESTTTPTTKRRSTPVLDAPSLLLTLPRSALQEPLSEAPIVLQRTRETRVVE
jgi:hypothetical protein